MFFLYSIILFLVFALPVYSACQVEWKIRAKETVKNGWLFLIALEPLN